MRKRTRQTFSGYIIWSLIGLLSLAASASGAIYTQTFSFPDGTTDFVDGSSLIKEGSHQPAVQNGKLVLSSRDQSGSGSFLIPPVLGSQWGFDMEFTVQISGRAGFAADQVEMHYGPAGEDILRGTATESLGCMIDTWNNGYTTPDQGIKAYCLGEPIYYRKFDPRNGAETLNWAVKVSWDPGTGMSMWVNGVSEFENVPTPGFKGDDDYNFWIVGLVGGVFQTALIDNLVINTKAPPKFPLVIPESDRGIISGGGEYEPNTVAAVRALPIAGYLFGNWTGDVNGKDNPVQITMDGPKQVAANFVQDSRDFDGDGLTNYEEIILHGTDESAADSDRDGFNDKFEITTGFNPKLASSTPDLLSEIRTAVELRFNAAVSSTYRVEQSADLRNWTTVEDGIAGTGDVISRFYPLNNSTRIYYRVRKN